MGEYEKRIANHGERWFAIRCFFLTREYAYKENSVIPKKEATEYDGEECRSARELSGLLGYAQWRNFENIIDKAKTACVNAGQEVAYHFADVSKMIDLAKAEEILSGVFYERGVDSKGQEEIAKNLKKSGRR